MLPVISELILGVSRKSNTVIVNKIRRRYEEKSIRKVVISDPSETPPARFEFSGKYHPVPP